MREMDSVKNSCLRGRTKMSKLLKSIKKLVFLSVNAKNLAKTSSLHSKRTWTLMLSWLLRKRKEMMNKNLQLQLRLRTLCRVLARLEVVLESQHIKLALLVVAVFNLRFQDPILLWHLDTKIIQSREPRLVSNSKKK